METIYRCGGLRWRGLAAVGAVTFALLGTSTVAHGQEIRVKFLDGRTGRPVTYEGAQLSVEGYKKGFLSAPANNKQGTARFVYTGKSIRAIWPPNTKLRYPWMRELPTALPPDAERIAAGPEGGAEVCWKMGFPPHNPWYPLSEILQHGAVSENHCGKARAKAKPGELILFIKPLSFWRRLLDGFRS